MEKEIYDEIFKIEEQHWWHVAERGMVLGFFDLYSKKDLLLNVGCGTGITSSILSNSTGVINIDISLDAIRYSLKRGNKNHVLCDCAQLPFKDHIFDTLIADNVLEHTPDDSGVLQGFRRIVQKDGVIILSIPANPWLWSPHDEVAHHKRRYSLGRMRRLSKDSNLEVVRMTHWNAFLFLPIAFFKLYNRLFDITNIGLKQPPRIINHILKNILGIEKRLIAQHHINLPFGISIFAVLKK
ncbi:class I SAM-dependent methyltransferase [Candidatus Altiarchaeota archaeon]